MDTMKIFPLLIMLPLTLSFHPNNIIPNKNFIRKINSNLQLNDVVTSGRLPIWLTNSLNKFKKLVLTTSVATTTLMPNKISPKTGLFNTPSEAEMIDYRTRDGYNGDSTYKTASASTVVGTSFVRDAVKRVGPSVVRVDCEREIPQFLAMFNDQYKENDIVKVGGSGIITSADGYILTNAHVTENARKVSISLSNGRVYKCRVISSDELTDLALLKADVGNDVLHPAPLGDSSRLNSGDWVIAVGNPVGLDFTVTLGIISNPRRSAYEVGAPHMKGFFL